MKRGPVSLAQLALLAGVVRALVIGSVLGVPCPREYAVRDLRCGDDPIRHRTFGRRHDVATPRTCVGTDVSRRFLAHSAQPSGYWLKCVCQTGKRQSGSSHPATYAPGDARRTGEGDPGTGRTSRSRDDAAVHAPEPGGTRRRDPAIGGAGRKRAARPWRTSGGAWNGALIAPVLLKKMVEAPGFAPGSENTSPQESTMRIHLYNVAPDVKRRKNRQTPTPKTSRR